MAADLTDNSQGGDLSELLNLTVPADVNALDTITDAIAANLESLQLPEQKRLEIGLAVQEALVNAVVHGCKGDSSKHVTCRMDVDRGGRIVIMVSDPGPGFDLEKLPDPKQPERMQHDHGRGVYLIRQLMDDVRFERGGRQVRMWKY